LNQEVSSVEARQFRMVRLIPVMQPGQGSPWAFYGVDQIGNVYFGRVELDPEENFPKRIVWRAVPCEFM
jgi:hypothetical protein